MKSTALARRLCTVIMPPYPKEEMMAILTKKGVTAAKALLLVESYQEQLAYALKFNKEPAPTFRDVLKLAEQVRKGMEEAPEEKETEECKPLRKHSLFKDKQSINPEVLNRLIEENRALLKQFKWTYFAVDKLLKKQLTTLVQGLNHTIQAFIQSEDYTPKAIESLYIGYRKQISASIESIKKTPSLKYDGRFTPVLKCIEVFLNTLLQLFYKKIKPFAFTTSTKVDIFTADLDEAVNQLNSVPKK